MLGFNRWQLFTGFAAILCIVGVTSLALIYFIPAPPTTVTLATAVSIITAGDTGTISHVLT